MTYALPMTRSSAPADFKSWLLSQGYLAQTAYEYDRAVKRLMPDGGDAVRPARDLEYAAIARYAAYLAERGDALEQLARALAERPKRTQVSRRRDEQARTRARSVSIPDEQWARLSAALEAQEDRAAARVLEVLVETGLRIGDALGVERTALDEAARSGRLRLRTKGGKERILPYSDAWKRMLAQWKAEEKSVRVDRSSSTVLWPTVGCWLMHRREPVDAGRRDSAAYKRVERALKAVAKTADVSGRVHLHRIRRTVGVQALRMTRDTATVQQMLGHASIQTTAGYLDEARPDDIAEVQEQIRNRFRKT